MDWTGVLGRPKLMSARVGLLRLHRAGLIELPAPSGRNPTFVHDAATQGDDLWAITWKKQDPGRTLEYYDCIEAPCLDECPVDQKVPQYMDAVRRGDFAAAVRLTREDNPLPSILGQVCDPLCETTCIRTHLDQPLAIRHIKRYIMDSEETPVMFPTVASTGDVLPGELLCRLPEDIF